MSDLDKNDSLHASGSNINPEQTIIDKEHLTHKVSTRETESDYCSEIYEKSH